MKIVSRVVTCKEYFGKELATMNDEFTTIRSRRRTEIKIGGSRFIGTAIPVSSKEKCDETIAELRTEFWDATHNCFAYRLGLDETRFRYSDDGEPSNSAGKPILASIDKFGLTNVLVVVTRYFGGTKLGVGGLVRAYSSAAEAVLQNSEKLAMYIPATIEATFPHSHISNVMHVVSKAGAKIIDTLYDEDVHTTLEIRLSKEEELKAALVNQTSGNIAFKKERAPGS